ncbi:MAG: VanW family protein [Lachnospiraceae bacterium]|nr:VanW family protein [Lachnospiraceae bacterium]
MEYNRYRTNEYSRDYEGYGKNRNLSRSRDALNRYRLSRRRKSNNIFKFVGLALAVLVVLVLSIFGAYKFIQYRNDKKALEGFSNVQMKQDIYLDFSIIGMKKPFSIQGLTKQEVYDKVLGSYDFDIKISNSNPEIDLFDMPKYGAKVEDTDYSKYFNKSNDNLGSRQEVEVENPLADITITASKNSFKVPDFVEGQLKKFIDDIYDKYLYVSTNEFSKKNVDVNASNFKADFIFKVQTNDENLDSALSQLARLWNTKPVKGQIEGFDAERNEFTFGDDHKGYIIDEDALRKKVLDEVNAGNLKTEIWTMLNMVDADGPSVRSRYKYVSMFETWTTDNEKRNKNINLACNGLNGYIVKPGQEFSFNQVLGERTEERGYDYAPAYLEGQVIEELGGGICQVSTTLYNAVFAAGLTTTFRKSHTYVPSYITPGLDATVSFHGPDYRFINNSNYTVGIKAQYSKQKVKIDIFAVPLLKEGQTQNLISNKIQDLDLPTISIINEGKASKGSQGSEWQVFKVVKEGDKEIERVFDHQTIYQGHTPTAFEEYTYVDDDGVLQTSKFVETRKEESTARRNTSITTARRGNTIQSIAPTESVTGIVVEMAPGGGSRTGQPQ